ncbi:MAG: 2-oxoacid:acceptor oxidoreductase family protein [Dehalococcoidales bacterium]|nr:MAG: 2-oxoacid:acceptor oxidoreductase family protein [Dehalococcoidales bacterium]
MAAKHEIRLCGFGGQGVILAGYIIGQAAAVYEGINAVFTQDYGPEARGGACRADVILSEEPVHYPYIDTPSVLVIMSQAAYDKYFSGISADTLVIIDEDLVTTSDTGGRRVLGVPANRLAEELGRVTITNVVMLGFLTAVTDMLSADAVKKSILASVPEGTGDLNLSAFEKGFEYARATAS